MLQGKRCPAVYAGLMGIAMGNPSSVVAFPFENFLTSPQSAYIQFALGLVAGVTLSSAAHLAWYSAKESRLRREAERNLQYRRPVAAVEEEPDSDFKIRMQASATLAPKRSAASKGVGRHMAASEWESSGVIRVLDDKADKAGSNQGNNDNDMSWLDASLTNGALGYTPLYAHYDPNDYTSVAEKYVKHKTFRERLEMRRQGVASILAERLGADPFEGLPVIERADGTVGDVGTPWWDHALGAQILHVDEREDGAVSATGGVASVNKETEGLTPTRFYRASDSQADIFERRAHAAEAARIADSSSEMYDNISSASKRADYIKQKVNEIDVGVYPEHRTIADLEREDVWDMALKAMEERLNSKPSSFFIDAIGAIETIDEPLGIEDSTGFIPFKVHANHPEVVDTNSYVDYLVDDELAHIARQYALTHPEETEEEKPAKPSKAKRATRAAMNYLTVIKGGGQRNADQDDPEEPYRPRHLATKNTSVARDA